MAERTKTHSGSLLDKVCRLSVGETVVLPQETPEQCVTSQRRLLASSRYPTSMTGMRFTTQACTVVVDVRTVFVGVVVTRLPIDPVDAAIAAGVGSGA